MARDPDLYRRLGLDRAASAQDVHRAYRRASKRAHPDAGGTAESWGALVEAYDVLRDNARRHRYDETGEIGATPADTHQAAVLCRIAMVLEAIGQQAAQMGRPLTQIDWPGSLRSSLNAEIARERQGLTDLNKRAEQWQRVAGRAKMPPGQANILRALAIGKENETRQRIAQVTREIGEREEAIALLKDQTFEVETAPPAAFGYGLAGASPLWQMRPAGGMW